MIQFHNSGNFRNIHSKCNKKISKPGGSIPCFNGLMFSFKQANIFDHAFYNTSHKTFWHNKKPPPCLGTVFQLAKFGSSQIISAKKWGFNVSFPFEYSNLLLWFYYRRKGQTIILTLTLRKFEGNSALQTWQCPKTADFPWMINFVDMYFKSIRVLA